MSSIRNVQFTPAMSASPDYSANDCIGTKMEIATNFFLNSRAMELLAPLVSDKAGVGPALSIYLFNTEPTGGTYTDNGTLSLSVADAAALVAKISVVAAEYTTAGSYKITYPERYAKQLKSGTHNNSLWAIVVADGSYNGASTADLVIDLWFKS